MAWPDQIPPATDVLLSVNVPCSGGGTPACLEVDKLPDGHYRATVGTLFVNVGNLAIAVLQVEATPAVSGRRRYMALAG